LKKNNNPELIPSFIFDPGAQAMLEKIHKNLFLFYRETGILRTKL